MSLFHQLALTDFEVQGKYSRNCATTLIHFSIPDPWVKTEKCYLNIHSHILNKSYCLKGQSVVRPGLITSRCGMWFPSGLLHGCSQLLLVRQSRGPDTRRHAQYCQMGSVELSWWRLTFIVFEGKELYTAKKREKSHL